MRREGNGTRRVARRTGVAVGPRCALRRAIGRALLAGIGAAFCLLPGAYASTEADAAATPPSARGTTRGATSDATPRADPGAAALVESDAGTDAGAALRVVLEPGERAGEIVFRLVNDGTETVSVLPAGTPLEPVLSTDAFLIERSTKGWPALERAAYTGRVAKRVPPGEDDFVTLAPGESRAVAVPLGRYYDAPEAGEYRVAWRGEIRVRSPGADAPRPAAGGVATTAVRLVARGPMSRLEPGSGSTRARPAAFEGCDSTRRAALNEATPAAERLVADALRELEARPNGRLAAAPRYTRWFGPWAAARERRVTSVYAALLDALSGATLSYDCSCTDETLYAYVYPSRLHDVFLCPAFFRAGLLGTDSRAGTLVHELSHFPSIAGTHDHVYGHDAVAGLALSAPALAVGNADSYEYFAENTPALAMEGGVPLIDGELSAGGDPSVGESAFTPLPLDAVVTGALDGGRLERFTANGAGLVAVDSLDGDADLYVFDDPGLHALVCASTTLERSGASETCRVDDGRTAYVVVHAYTDTRYAIRASATDGLGGPLPAPLPTALPASDPVPVIGPTGERADGGDGTAAPLAPTDVSVSAGPPSTPSATPAAPTAPPVATPSDDGAAVLPPDDAPAATDAASREPAADVASASGATGGLGAPGVHWLVAGIALLGRRRPRRHPAGRRTATGRRERATIRPAVTPGAGCPRTPPSASRGSGRCPPRGR